MAGLTTAGLTTAGLTTQLAPHSDKKSQILEEQTSHSIAKPQSAIAQSARPEGAIAYSVVYALPGRVGFCVPQISLDPTYTQRLLTLLACDPRVLSQQVNEIAGSIVIDYKSGIMSDGEMRLYLARLIQSASSEVTTKAPEKAAQLSLQCDEKSQIVEQQTSHPTAKPHSPVVYSIVYATSGSVGFCVPQISLDPAYVQRLLTLLACDPRVISQQVNEDAGSIVINYQPGIVPDVQMRLCLANTIEFAGASEEITPVTEKPVSLSSVSQIAACPSVPQEKENDYEPVGAKVLSDPGLVREEKENGSETVKANVLSDPEVVRMETSLDSKLETAKVSPSCELKGADKIPTSSNKCNHTPDKTDHKTKKPAKVAYSIAHAIPGRVRFRIPRIAKDSKYVQRLEALLKADALVTGKRVNSAAASIVITYKSGTIPNSKKRSLSLLEQVISYLSSLIQSAASDAVVSIS
ncbi:HMA2 domain-containing protein [Brasilonema bromeliae]|uniref:NolW-like domain-containing protein n=1 Tax=Brasilonema bromeliae SPC951 TaxID=385972 RepID=A0ABX1PAZ8_9CYAN|nr:hypothetical protein [Brasilonema bromeliae]NMG20962.1 hypothetical protein [Brasilonema bromeliae SPC951]